MDGALIILLMVAARVLLPLGALLMIGSRLDRRAQKQLRS